MKYRTYSAINFAPVLLLSLTVESTSKSTGSGIICSVKATFAQLLNTTRDFNAASVALSHIYAIL